MAYSVARQNFVYIDVTDARESERAHVLTDRLSDCLIIADRGYVSFELEKKIGESNNRFIIKGKCNTAGEIKAAFDSNSEELSDLIGSNLKDVKIKERMDFDTSPNAAFPQGTGMTNRTNLPQRRTNAAWCASRMRAGTAKRSLSL